MFVCVSTCMYRDWGGGGSLRADIKTQIKRNALPTYKYLHFSLLYISSANQLFNYFLVDSSVYL